MTYKMSWGHRYNILIAQLKMFQTFRRLLAWWELCIGPWVMLAKGFKISWYDGPAWKVIRIWYKNESICDICPLSSKTPEGNEWLITITDDGGGLHHMYFPGPKTRGGLDIDSGFGPRKS